jgi:hypothetical protein
MQLIIVEVEEQIEDNHEPVKGAYDTSRRTNIHHFYQVPVEDLKNIW